MRLIPTREDNAAMSMAIDEAILKARSENKVEDTFRLFKFKPSSVSLGYFQSYDQEIFHDNRLKKEVDAVRRITGGGAVFHDYDGEITYSIILSEESAGKNIQESYRLICSGLTNALAEFGISAEFLPINDVLAGGKKISGSAQTRKWGAVLQHGTMMYNTDLDLLFSVLNVSKAKIADKILASIKDRVTNVNQQLELLGKPGNVGGDEVEAAMIKGFEKVFGKFEKSDLTDGEMNMAKELAETKYGTDDWLHKK
ncbi:biotin/lipoate A/B protein ligase family protein [Candidatus Undinarchaeota archaeon]